MSYFDAFIVARPAPAQAWGETVHEKARVAKWTMVSDSSEDEASDEDTDMTDQRQMAKAVCQEAVASRCLPASAQQPPPQKSPFASMLMLSEAADLLGSITAQPAQERSGSTIWQKLQAANLLPGSPTTAAPITPSRPITSVDSRQAPSSPAKLSKAHRHTDAMKRATGTEFFCMEATEDCSTKNASALKEKRESSLARSYDALGAEHYSLDDSSDAELSRASGRGSSITRDYDNMGRSSHKSRRSVTSKDAPVCRNKSPAASAAPSPSAMDLDVGVWGIDASAQCSRRGSADADWASVSKPTAQKRQARSVGSAHVTNAASRSAVSLTLPPLEGGARGVGGASVRNKSGFLMKSESVGAPLWGIPAPRSAMQKASRELLC